MIKSYDIAIALFWAWIILNFMFVPYIGFIIAYGLLRVWDMYCGYRLGQEHDG
jgi:hypothetical protein